MAIKKFNPGTKRQSETELRSAEPKPPFAASRAIRIIGLTLGAFAVFWMLDQGAYILAHRLQEQQLQKYIKKMQDYEQQQKDLAPN
jgi:hypothetical protein